MIVFYDFVFKSSHPLFFLYILIFPFQNVYFLSITSLFVCQPYACILLVFDLCRRRFVPQYFKDISSLLSPIEGKNIYHSYDLVFSSLFFHCIGRNFININVCVYFDFFVGFPTFTSKNGTNFRTPWTFCK